VRREQEPLQTLLGGSNQENSRNSKAILHKALPPAGIHQLSLGGLGKHLEKAQDPKRKNEHQQSASRCRSDQKGAQGGVERRVRLLTAP
jgi:hypothetical protein